MEQDFDPKRERWLKERYGLVTSSGLAILNTGGRRDLTTEEIEQYGGKRKTADVEFGQSAINYLYQLKYERRTGIGRSEVSAKNFEWGRENEPVAVAWRREQDMKTILHCSEDFDEIVFYKPFEGFGDSPDCLIQNAKGETEGVVEIQCSVDQAFIEKVWSDDYSVARADKYYQFLGHFLGCLEAKYIEWLIFDAYTYQGRIIRIDRSEFEPEIAKQKEKIIRASQYVDLCLIDPDKYKLTEINQYYAKSM